MQCGMYWTAYIPHNVKWGWTSDENAVYFGLLNFCKVWHASYFCQTLCFVIAKRFKGRIFPKFAIKSCCTLTAQNRTGEREGVLQQTCRATVNFDPSLFLQSFNWSQNHNSEFKISLLNQKVSLPCHCPRSVYTYMLFHNQSDVIVLTMTLLHFIVVCAFCVTRCCC